MTYSSFALALTALLTPSILNVQFTGPGYTYQPLAAVTNDRNSSVDSLSLVLNLQGSVEGIRFQPGHAPAPIDFTDAQMASSQGANLEEDSHRPIVLHATFNSQNGSASWVIDYLSNGLFGSYKSCNAALARDPQGQWHLINAYTREPVTQLRITTWALGISSIVGICP